MTAVVLYGPKAVGKSQVAEVLRRDLNVWHVDVDALVLGLLAEGARPHQQHGWLEHVEEAVTEALTRHVAVSVEATGAWDSDWQLAQDLEQRGQRVIRVWITAPLDLTLRRLAERTTLRVPVPESEARWICHAAYDRARHQQFQLEVDTGRVPVEDLPRALAPLAQLLLDTGPTNSDSYGP